MQWPPQQSPSAATAANMIMHVCGTFTANMIMHVCDTLMANSDCDCGIDTWHIDLHVDCIYVMYYYQ
jgi:hypothetical protein